MSEIAQLRQRIEAECEAMRRALFAPAIAASHDAITHKYSVLGRYHDQLARHIGEEKAVEVLCDAYNRIVG